MSHVKLSAAAFPSFSETFDFEDGYSAFSWEQIQEHVFSSEILELLTAIKPDFNRENTFTLKASNGFAEAVYAFTLCRDNASGKAVLTFGNGSENNVVEITEGIERVRGANVKVYKVGEAVLEFRAGNQDSIICNVAYGNTSMDVKSKFVEGVTDKHLSPLPDIVDFAEMVTPIGTYGYKLKDIVRPLVRKGVKKLDGVIVMKVLSWQALEKKAGYPQSIEINVEYTGDIYQRNGKENILKKNHYPAIAMNEQGETITRVTKLYVSTDQNSGSQLFDNDFSKKAYLTYQNGGEVRLLITSIPTSQPEYYHPQNMIQLVPGNSSKQVQQARLEPAKTASVSDIMPIETVPVPVKVVSEDDLPF